MDSDGFSPHVVMVKYTSVYLLIFIELGSTRRDITRRNISPTSERGVPSLSLFGGTCFILESHTSCIISLSFP